ncbi:MAG: hypothetical protein JHC26_06780 [Thermofilum sp.]|jgi:hypothetical protein|nr:hypothetical protein [Thermofilum sp.]
MTQKRPTKEELNELVFNVAMKDPLLFKELAKVEFNEKRVPEALINYEIKKKDPIVLEILLKAYYSSMVARYFDYLARNNLPIKRKFLIRIADYLLKMGFREERGLDSMHLYVNGFIEKEGLPFEAKMDALPEFAKIVILYYRGKRVELSVID